MYSSICVLTFIIVGTNITVYHDFHDEVSLYKQHWWRCDGPCQKWKPYFGMVRRATNRAPGPNDRWWGEHSRNCGGTFIKVSTFLTFNSFINGTYSKSNYIEDWYSFRYLFEIDII